MKNRGMEQHRRPGLWRRLLFIAVLIGLFFVVYKNMSVVKSLVKKQATIYRFAQKGKYFWDEKIPALIKKVKPQKKQLKNITITVDANQTVEQYEKFWGGFGSDYFYSGVSHPKNRAFFKLVAEVNRTRKVFNYYRAHNIFSDRDAPNGDPCGGKVYNEDAQGNPIYNWDRIDQVFDTIIHSGLKPIVEFGFMPEALTSDPNRKGDWHLANVAPPKDYMKWRNLVFETVKHLEARYGAQEIQTWYFEVWNEPDLYEHFWVPDPRQPDQTFLSEYLKLYDYTVAGATAANSNIKIGGPAIAGWPYVLEGFIDHAVSKSNYVTGTKDGRIDFISFHKYGDVDENIIEPSVKLIKSALSIDKEKVKSIPFLLTEFGPTTQSLEQWKNTRYTAAWICKTVDAFFELGMKKGLHFRPQAMIFWSSVGDNYRDGEGMLASTIGPDPNHIVKGPVFNAYHALSYLSPERIALQGANYGDEVHGIATKNGNSSAEILLYRFNDYWSTENDSVEVNLVVENLAFAEFFIHQFVIDEHHSNAYAVWKNMGSPTQISAEKISWLLKKDDLELITPVSRHKAANGATFTKILKLPSNSIALLVLSKVTDFVAPIAPKFLAASNVSYHSVQLSWQTPEPASDGDIPSSYLVYRGDSLLATIFSESYLDTNLTDDTHYRYQVYAVDEQGNRSENPATLSIHTLRDANPPELIAVNIINLVTLELQFNEALNFNLASDVNNYAIDSGIDVKSVAVHEGGKRIRLTTTPHQKGSAYHLKIFRLADLANPPNELTDFQVDYDFSLKFKDQFDFDNLNSYIWKHVWQDGGIGNKYYDATEKRLKIITGDDVGESFSHDVPETSEGTFAVDFHPISFYPTGGKLFLRLQQNENTYYEIASTCGYGHGYLKKVLQGTTIDSTSLFYEYKQGTTYKLNVNFAPEAVSLYGFSESATIERNKYPIQVRKFEIELVQQDAFFDNINYQSN